MSELIKYVQEQLIEKPTFPVFKAGDNVTVSIRIREGEKTRIQLFRGDVLQRKGKGATQTFTVRKISNGVGVEKVFPLFSPSIESIEVNKHGKVRRSRIYYLRDLRGKASRIKEKRRAN